MENKQVLSHGIFWASELNYLKDVFSKFLQGKLFLDLGSGDGKVVKFAYNFSNYVNGVEIDKKLYEDSEVKNWIMNDNLFNINFKSYDILYYYLKGSKHELELIQKLNEEFKDYLIIYYKSMKEKQVDVFASFLKADVCYVSEYVKVYKFQTS